MIIAQMSGGLGNQMFQYAAGLALAEHHQTVLKLDVCWYRKVGDRVPHERYGLGCFNICEHFATADEIERAMRCKPGRIGRKFGRGLRKLRLGWLAGVTEGTGPAYLESPSNENANFFAQPDGSYLIGLWQSESYFAPVSALLRRHFSFRYPVPASANALLDQILDDPVAVAVHIRRGDFGRRAGQEFNQSLPLDYYYRALSKLECDKDELSVYVFSDDPEWVSEHFRYQSRLTVVSPAADWQAFDELALMSSCRHFVIANSTFSWWAAWLDNREGKTVIAPEPWFTGKKATRRGFLPHDWKKEASGLSAS